MPGPAMTRTYPEMKQADPDVRCCFTTLKPVETCVAEMAGMYGQRVCGNWELLAGDHGGTRRRGGLGARAGDEEPLHALYQGSMVGAASILVGFYFADAVRSASSDVIGDRR